MWPPYVEVIAAMQVLKHIIEQLGNPFESFEQAEPRSKNRFASSPSADEVMVPARCQSEVVVVSLTREEPDVCTERC